MSESNMKVVDEVSAPEKDPVEIVVASLELEKINAHPFGDFAGALSWPIPLTVAQQKEVLDATSVYLDSLDLVSIPGAGVLDYLDVDERLSDEALKDPPAALASLINSTRGQALGLAIQTRLNGIATDVSASEYAMAGIHLSLHQGDIDQPSRSKVAGFDLAGEKLWGKPAVQVFNTLADYLIKERLSSRRLAGLTAALLLVRKAPEFLIEQLPPDLKYGTTAWFNLTVAARTIEAHTPGKVAYMTFAQVMASAESAVQVDSQVVQHVQAAALADWGVVSGVVQKNHSEHYTRDELESAKTHFNLQLADRLNTSILLNSELPSRQAIALARLKNTFKGDLPFEERLLEQPKVIALDGAHLYPTLNGRYSLLDIVMMGGPPYYQWTTRDPRLLPLLDQINAPLELGVTEAFQTQFENAVSNLKQGARLFVKHLIAELPLEDRKNLEHGHVSFYQYKTYRLSLNLWGRNLISTDRMLRVKVELDHESKLYEIDLKKGGIHTSTYDSAEATERTNPSVPSIKHTIESFNLADEAKAEKLLAHTANGISVPASYSSERTELIAQAFVEHLDLDSEDILNAAKGQTTQERENAVVQKVIDFVVDLIPFKSAITNFINGKYFDGAVDLFFDALGFVTAGASTVAKLTQVVGKSASALSRGLRAARVIGVFVISELNPLTAFVAGGKFLVMGVKYLGLKGLQQLDRFREAVFGYDLLIGVSKQHGPAALGVFQVGAHSYESVGVLQGAGWYPYSPLSKRPYGVPGDFRPSGVGGFGNYDMRTFAIKPSVVAGLEANAKGIFRSTDGQRFYIRNIDATGHQAYYRISNDFSLNAELTDVVIVDHTTGRANGSRLWQVAPDQWQPVSLRGGDLPAEAADVPAGAIIDENASLANQLVFTANNPLNLETAFVRERLPNGLWEPVIETIRNSQTAHLPFDWGQRFTTHYSFQRTDIHRALSVDEFSRLSVVGSLTKTNASEYSASIKAQLARTDSGANFFFVMERIQPANSVGKEFNALKIHDLEVDKLPVGANAVSGYWAPQGGYVDIPVHPKWGQPDYLFTPDFSGCSLVVNQLDSHLLRVRHVEGAKEFAQYNGLPTDEHGWGLSTSMEFQDYGLRVNANGDADSILTGFAFMKYDRQAGSWKLHFQSVQGAPRIGKHSSAKPGWGAPPETVVEVFSEYKVTKVVNRPVMTIVGVTAG